MKAIVAQLNTTPADFQGNFDKILSAYGRGVYEKADIVICPELSIPGYLSKDYLYEDGYVEKNLSTLHMLVEVSRDLDFHYSTHTQHYPYLVVGYFDKNYSDGKPFKNMLAVIRKGIVVATYQKKLLPFYDVFDEGRYFEPGNDDLVLEIAGERWGFAICEDLWYDKSEPLYHKNPAESYLKKGVKNLISINSSPYVKGKRNVRRNVALDSDFDKIIYVNQVGGQDELIFDGGSFFWNKPNIYLEHQPKECIFVIDTDRTESNCLGTNGDSNNSIPLIHDLLVLGIRDYCQKNGFERVVLGSSGGIDSAVVLALACKALGPQNVNAIQMPSSISSKGSIDDSSKLHKNLGCNEFLCPISNITSQKDGFNICKYIETSLKMDSVNSVARENIQARIRGNIVMYFSNGSKKCLPLTTGNKTELAVGYCTLYGDMSGGLAPISDLLKGEVYELARYINRSDGKEIIPSDIIEKPPSAELAEGQTDEAQLLPYPILDEIVRLCVEENIADFENFKKHKDIVQKISKEWLFDSSGKSIGDYNRIISLIDANEFKRRQAAPGIKITRKAFGSGRRLPITKKKRNW